MIHALIVLIFVLIVVGVAIWLLDILPIDAKLKQIAKVLAILVAVLIVLANLLPFLGVSGL